MMDKPQPISWVRCPKGSCQHHQACMYTPCRSVKTDKPTYEDPEALRRGRIALGLEEEDNEK